jgi:caffeoyl-CoA O-methyltransferase
MSFVAKEIETYCQNHSHVPSSVCEEISKYTIANVPMSVMLCGPVVGSFLKTMITSVKAKRVLEVGTYTGYSALAMAESLPNEGELITLDINPETAAIAQSFWNQSPHGKKITQKVAPALESLNQLSGKFDFVFIDADKPGYLSYLNKILPMLSNQGMIVADNCLYGGEVLDPKEKSPIALNEFNKWVTGQSNLQASLLPIRDGLMVISKKSN